MEKSDIEENLSGWVIIFTRGVCEFLKKSDKSSAYRLLLWSVFSGWISPTFCWIAGAAPQQRWQKVRGTVGSPAWCPLQTEALGIRSLVLKYAFGEPESVWSKLWRMSQIYICVKLLAEISSLPDQMLPLHPKTAIPIMNTKQQFSLIWASPTSTTRKNS